jgi:hypothetical protein
MRARWVFPVFAVVLAACGGLRGDRQQGAAPWGPDAMLLLGSSTGVVSLDPADGSVAHRGTGVPTLGDWSTVFTTRLSEGRTLLEGRDAATGAVRSKVSLPGELAVRVASVIGSQVALMEPLPEGHSPWTPVPRATTDIVVADPTGARDPLRFHLPGNLEPEAFSQNGRNLYLIRFVPPTDPVAYRVAQLDLSTGRTYPVATGTKPAVVETMAGTRLEQLASPDGGMLYTLYTTDPAAYAGAHAHEADPVAFIHTLSLEEGWAHCVALPKAMWGSDPMNEAMALSPNGKRLYLVDTARDLVGIMNTRNLRMKSIDVDFPDAVGPAQAAVGSDGMLFASGGTWLVNVDLSQGAITGRRTMPEAVSTLGTGPGGLYVAMPDRVEVVDPNLGERVATVPSPAVEDLAYVGVATP